MGTFPVNRRWQPPCATSDTPELWDDSDIRARIICLTECPAAQHQFCASEALSADFGVWAGVQLPGIQHRQRKELNRCRDLLQSIASGRITSDEIPENAELLTLLTKRECSRCHLSKHEYEFYQRPTQQKRKHYSCKECQREQARDTRKKAS